MKKTKKQIEVEINERDQIAAQKLLLNEDYNQEIKKHKRLILKKKELLKDRNELNKQLENEFYVPREVSASDPLFEPIQKLKRISKSLVELEHEEAKTIKFLSDLTKQHSAAYPNHRCHPESLKIIASGKGRFHEDLSNIVTAIPEEIPYVGGKTKPGVRSSSSMRFLYKNGYIYFKVKATASRNIIYFLLDEWLDVYTKGIQKKRFRKGGIDTLKEKLEIYDAVNKGKSRLQIAKERSGINKNPSYDETGRVKAEYEKVKRYYNDAQKLIK